MELLPFMVDIGDNEDLFKIPFADIGKNLGYLVGSLLAGMIVSYFKQGNIYSREATCIICNLIDLAKKASRIITPIGYLYVICCAIISLVKVK